MQNQFFKYLEYLDAFFFSVFEIFDRKIQIFLDINKERVFLQTLALTKLDNKFLPWQSLQKSSWRRRQIVSQTY